MSSDPRHPDRISTAMVMADGLATIYRRWGSGRTVLLLGVSEAIALALGDSFRVIVPELPLGFPDGGAARWRSEEHTSELQSPCNLVCRLLLEKKKKKNNELN